MTMPDRMPPENAKEVTRRIAISISRLVMSENLDISQMAERVNSRINSGAIERVDLSPFTPCPSMTAFDLAPVASGVYKNKFQQVIVINHDAIMGGTQEELDADMARTFAVADQYPDRYTDSFSDIYDRAFDMQIKWLSQPGMNVRLNPDLDPRIADREVLKVGIMGSDRYFCDTSLRDWNDMLLSGVMFSDYKDQIVRFRDLDNNKQLFIDRRQMYTREVFSDLNDNDPDFITNDDAGTRARKVVLRFLRNTLSDFRRAASN